MLKVVLPSSLENWNVEKRDFGANDLKENKIFVAILK